MTIQTGEHAIADAVEQLRKHEKTSGGHSWGLAIPHDGELYRLRDVGPVPRFPQQELPAHVVEDATVCLGHTRYATRGSVTKENAHPFTVENADGEVVAMLAHNGTWHQAPRDGQHADSWFIAKELEHLVQTMESWPFEELLKIVGRFVGETITVVHRDGRAWAYSGRFTITADERAGVVASSGHDEIPTGELYQVTDGMPGEQGRLSTAGLDLEADD